MQNKKISQIISITLIIGIDIAKDKHVTHVQDKRGIPIVENQIYGLGHECHRKYNNKAM